MGVAQVVDIIIEELSFIANAMVISFVYVLIINIKASCFAPSSKFPSDSGGLCDMSCEINKSVGVPVLIIVPGDDLDEFGTHPDTGSGVEY